jgi:hypothetical protein
MRGEEAPTHAKDDCSSIGAFLGCEYVHRESDAVLSAIDNILLPRESLLIGREQAGRLSHNGDKAYQKAKHTLHRKLLRNELN